LVQNVQQPKKANRDAPATHHIPHISTTIDKKWNAKKTLKANYATVGLSFDPNKTIEETTKKLIDKGVMEDEYEADLDELIAKELPREKGVHKLEEDLEVPEAAPPKQPTLGTRERHYWVALYKKYGDNFKKMQMDSKLNYLQHSAGTCKKKIHILLDYYGHLLE
jgi:hypothetical protein